MDAIGLNNIFNSLGEFSNSAQGIVNDQMQQKAQLDALAFQTQLETETNAFLQDLQKKPYGTDYNAEVNTYLQKIKGQMSDKNSPYYAANNYTADIYKKLLTQAQGNLQVQAQNISLKKETENSLLKAQSVMNWYRNNVSAQEAADKNFKVINYLKDKGYVSETDAYNMKTAEAQLDVLNNAQTDYLNLLEGGADPQTAEQAVLTKVTENFSSYQEEYSTGEMQKWIKSGITQAQNKVKQSQDINNDALIKKNMNLIVSLSDTDIEENITRLERQIASIQALPNLTLNASDYKSRISELLTQLHQQRNLLNVDANGKENLKHCLTFNQIEGFINDLGDSALTDLMNTFDPKDKTPYGLQNVIISKYADAITRYEDKLRTEGSSEEDIQLFKNDTVNKAIDRLTDGWLKNLKIGNAELEAVIKTEIDTLKRTINSSKSSYEDQQTARQNLSFVQDLLLNIDPRTTKPEDIQKRFNDYREALNLKNYDNLVNSKGEALKKEPNTESQIAGMLKQLENKETVWTDVDNKRIWLQPGVEEQVINYLKPTLERELRKNLNLTDADTIQFSWQVEGHDVDPILNFWINNDPSTLYRYVSDGKDKVKLELQHSYEETKNWDTVANVVPFQKKKNEVKELEKQTEQYYNKAVNENMGAITNIVREIYDHINKLPKDQYQEIMKEIDPTYEMDSPEQQQDALRRYLLKNGNGNLDTETMHKNAQKLINRYKK